MNLKPIFYNFTQQLNEAIEFLVINVERYSDARYFLPQYVNSKVKGYRNKCFKCRKI